MIKVRELNESEKLNFEDKDFIVFFGDDYRYFTKDELRDLKNKCSYVLNLPDVSGCFSELDMREAFKAGIHYERSCDYYSKQPKISKAGHIVSNPTPNFSEFIHKYNNR